MSQRSLRAFIPRKRWFKLEWYGEVEFVRALSAYGALRVNEYHRTFVPDSEVTVTELTDQDMMLERLAGNV